MGALSGPGGGEEGGGAPGRVGGGKEAKDQEEMRGAFSSTTGRKREMGTKRCKDSVPLRSRLTTHRQGGGASLCAAHGRSPLV